MKNRVLLFIIALISFNFVGCASILGQKNHTIRVTSNPPKATVEYKGQILGETPTDVKVGNRFNPGEIVVSKKGYRTARREVETNFQLIGILNLLFWPGFIIDLATGNTMGLDSNNMYVVLPEE